MNHFLDREGLENGLIQLQLFIHWDENNKFKGISAVYMESDKTMQVFQKPNQTSNEDEID